MLKEQDPIAALGDINLVNNNALAGAILERLERVLRITWCRPCSVRSNQHPARFTHAVKKGRQRSELNLSRLAFGFRFEISGHLYRDRFRKRGVALIGFRLLGLARGKCQNAGRCCGKEPSLHSFTLSILD